MYHRILIIGTVPYSPNSQSRAFDAYFHNFEREDLRQIFSDPNDPVKGHCSKLFQITDKRLLQKRFNKKIKTGKVFDYKDLNEVNNSNIKNTRSVFSLLYKLGSRKFPLNHLLRKALWKKKYWCTDEFLDFVDEFKPECVFLAFSDDFFVNEIALFVAERFDIPIMACIGDDYYFNDRKSISPFYYIYRKKYKRLVKKVFAHKCSAIYISDKIRDKYNAEFGIKGDTVYLTSDIPRKQFTPIDKEYPIISYCGNIRLGRNDSLVDIANALYQIDPKYRIDVYSGESDEKFIKPLLRTKNINYKGRVPYSKVMEVFSESDVVLIVEGFNKKDVIITRYSLSTKAADSITSGCQILSYGSHDCGVIEYMEDTKCSVVCTDKSSLIPKIRELLNDTDLQKQLYEKSQEVMGKHHNLIASNNKTERLFNELIAGESVER